MDLAGPVLTFTVSTYGDSCRSKGETGIALDSDNRELTLSPLDRITEGTVCTEILRTFIHSGTVVLDAPGSWTVVLVGQRLDGEAVAFTVGVEADFGMK